jgi:hypothetical protein
MDVATFKPEFEKYHVYLQKEYADAAERYERLAKIQQERDREARKKEVGSYSN